MCHETKTILMWESDRGRDESKSVGRNQVFTLHTEEQEVCSVITGKKEKNPAEVKRKCLLLLSERQQPSSVSVELDFIEPGELM